MSPAVDNPIVVGRKKGSGRKRKWTSEDIQAAMKEVSFSQRRTLASLSEAIGVPKSSLYRMLRLGDINRHSSSIRPILTAENIQTRIDYCALFVDPSCRLFSHLLDMVHMDEKWFYMSETTAKYYIAPDELPPNRRCKHKSRPRYDGHKEHGGMVSSRSLHTSCGSQINEAPRTDPLAQRKHTQSRSPRTSHVSGT